MLHLKLFKFSNFYFIFYSIDSSFFNFFFVSFDFCTLLNVKRWRSTVFIGNLNMYLRIYLNKSMFFNLMAKSLVCQNC